MASLQRETASRKLTRFLGQADDIGFCRLVWAIDALQSKRADSARRFLAYPKEAADADLDAALHIHKWMMETLVNELLAGRKERSTSGRHSKSVDCSQFEAMRYARNLLMILENEDDAVSLRERSVLSEMPRIAHRQFEWQRRIDTGPNLYRNAYMFGGTECTDYFVRRNGIAPSEFALCGFAMFASYQTSPHIPLQQSIPELGLTSEVFATTLRVIGRSLSESKEIARGKRSPPGHIAYKASVLREFPCIISNGQIFAPLIRLVLARTTAGLYYEVVPAGGSVTREIGSRFEDYCYDLMSATWGSRVVRREFKYGPRSRSHDSPDMFLMRNERIQVIVECKAKRMPISSRFGEDLGSSPETQRALDELAKGIFQIWRFRSHIRRGFADNAVADDDPVGVVLILDPWLSMARGRYADLKDRATRLADADGNILPVDRIPVAFCPIEDLEAVLSTATQETFTTAILKAANEEFAGWHFYNVHQRLEHRDTEERPYPLLHRISEVFPWWDKIE